MGSEERSIEMHIEKYLNEDGKVVMTEDEFNEMVDENNCMKAQIEELKTELKKAKDAEKDHLLLQVRYDQILRASKELAQCLQYETGNGFIK